MSAAPIRIECEGSHHPTHRPVSPWVPAGDWGMCAMCGATVRTTPDRIAYRHQRDDVLAMLARGDYDPGSDR